MRSEFVHSSAGANVASPSANFARAHTLCTYTRYTRTRQLGIGCHGAPPSFSSGRECVTLPARSTDGLSQTGVLKAFFSPFFFFGRPFIVFLCFIEVEIGFSSQHDHSPWSNESHSKKRSGRFCPQLETYS